VKMAAPSKAKSCPQSSETTEEESTKVVFDSHQTKLQSQSKRSRAQIQTKLLSQSKLGLKSDDAHMYLKLNRQF